MIHKEKLNDIYIYIYSKRKRGGRYLIEYLTSLGDVL